MKKYFMSLIAVTMFLVSSIALAAVSETNYTEEKRTKNVSAVETMKQSGGSYQFYYIEDCYINAVEGNGHLAVEFYRGSDDTLLASMALKLQDASNHQFCDLSQGTEGDNGSTSTLIKYIMNNGDYYYFKIRVSGDFGSQTTLNFISTGIQGPQGTVTLNGAGNYRFLMSWESQSG